MTWPRFEEHLLCQNPVFTGIVLGQMCPEPTTHCFAMDFLRNHYTTARSFWGFIGQTKCRLPGITDL
jgi:hypothetical protein